MKYATYLPFVQGFFALLVCKVVSAFTKALSTLLEPERVRPRAGWQDFLRIRLVLMSEYLFSAVRCVEEDLPDYVAYRDRVQRFAFAPCTSCGGCDLSRTSETDCFSNEAPACGGCLWAQGVIQCP